MKSVTRIAVTATMSALLIIGKWSLAAVANVEVVTLLIVAFSLSWGRPTLIAVAAFIVVDTAIWGLAPWVLSYIIYWPSLSIVFILLAKVINGKTLINNKLLQLLIITAIGTAMTALFGVLTSAVDTTIGLVGGNIVVNVTNWWSRFIKVYMFGVSFFAVHIANNALMLALLSLPLTKLLLNIKGNMLTSQGN